MLCWGENPWGVRRLLVHISQLPPNSAFSRKHLNAPLGWDNNTEMLAAVVDAVNVLTRVTINAHSTQAIQEPIPRVERPHETKTEYETPAISLSAFNAFLEKGDLQ